MKISESIDRVTVSGASDDLIHIGVDGDVHEISALGKLPAQVVLIDGDGYETHIIEVDYSGSWLVNFSPDQSPLKLPTHSTSRRVGKSYAQKMMISTDDVFDVVVKSSDGRIFWRFEDHCQECGRPHD